MSTRRTITVTLTEEQYRCLSSAVSTAAEEWGVMAEDVEGGYFRAELRKLDRAWSRVRDAWYERERNPRVLSPGAPDV